MNTMITKTITNIISTSNVAISDKDIAKLLRNNGLYIEHVQYTNTMNNLRKQGIIESRFKCIVKNTRKKMILVHSILSNQ